jgi:hypothetical protein
MGGMGYCHAGSVRREEEGSEGTAVLAVTLECGWSGNVEAGYLLSKLGFLDLQQTQ